MQEGRVFEQVLTFAVTMVTGIVLGLAYDVVRVARRFLRPSRFVLFFWDLFFWLLAAGMVFLVLLARNWGEVRAYVFLGLGLGGAVYALAMTRLCYGLLVRMVEKMLKVCRILAAPFTRLAAVLGPGAASCKKMMTRPLARGKQKLGKIKDRFHKKKE